MVSRDDQDEGDRDFLDEVIEESTRLNPQFPMLMERARRDGEAIAALDAQRDR